MSKDSEIQELKDRLDAMDEQNNNLYEILSNADILGQCEGCDGIFWIKELTWKESSCVYCCEECEL
jgi:hypothetical protein